MFQRVLYPVLPDESHSVYALSDWNLRELSAEKFDGNVWNARALIEKDAAFWGASVLLAADPTMEWTRDSNRQLLLGFLLGYETLHWKAINPGKLSSSQMRMKSITAVTPSSSRFANRNRKKRRIEDFLDMERITQPQEIFLGYAISYSFCPYST